MNLTAILTAPATAASSIPAEFYFFLVACVLLAAALVLLIQGLIEVCAGLPQRLDDFAERWKLWRTVCRTIRAQRH